MTRREEPIPVVSAALSHVMMAGLMLSAALSAFEPSRHDHNAPRPRMPDALDTPSPVASAAPSPTIAAAPPEKEEWPQDEITRGREQCMHLLSGTPADIEMLEPIKKGECGLPAPVRLRSVGSGPKVVFDPPVDVNCRMVAALEKWVKSTLQPKARDRLKSPVVRIVGASGYACRNIYNRPNARLSQHALANAIDIGGFGLANGRTVPILKGWGPTARDIEAQAKAKAEAEAKAKAARAKGDVARKRGGSAKESDPARPETPEPPVTRASLTPPPPASSSRLSKAPPTASPAATAVEPTKPTSEALFLRAIHGGACREFGTVLGPEANDPHRNHFHLDLIPRRGRGYCE